MEPFQAIDVRLGRLEKKFQHWGAKLDEIIARAEGRGTDLGEDWHDRIDELKAKRAAVELKFDESKASGSETWVSFKADVESAWNELELALKKLSSR